MADTPHRRKQQRGFFGSIFNVWAKLQMVFTVGSILVNALREYNTPTPRPKYRR